MAENKDFEAIMKTITGGLTGDRESDMEYLKDQCEKYKEHEYAQEIIRACGRIMYEIIPEDIKAELHKALSKDELGIDAALEEIRFNIYKKNHDKALEMIEAMLEKYEQGPLFTDDSVSEYHCFRGPMEEVLYRVHSGTEKTLRQSPIDYAEMYLLYGSLLVEMQRPEDAEKALAKAMRWNPGNAKIAFEHAETFKMRNLTDDFGRLTREIFKIAYLPEDLARCYRNMGYYFVETKDYKAAVCCLLFSSQFDKNDMVQSELYYIGQISGEVYNPSAEELHEIFQNHELPAGPDAEVLKASYFCGRSCYEKGDFPAARYFLEIFTCYIDDEQANKMLADAKEKLEKQA